MVAVDAVSAAAGPARATSPATATAAPAAPAMSLRMGLSVHPGEFGPGVPAPGTTVPGDGGMRHRAIDRSGGGRWRRAIGGRPPAVAPAGVGLVADPVPVEPGARVDGRAARGLHLHVQVRPGRAATVAHLGDLLACGHLLAHPDEGPVDVPVGGDGAVVVPHPDPQPEPARRT